MGQFSRGGGGQRGFGNRGGGRGFGGRRFGSRSGFSGFGSQEKHKAVCADCKQDCEVPFKPIEGRPVYCKECYARHKKF